MPLSSNIFLVKYSNALYLKFYMKSLSLSFTPYLNISSHVFSIQKTFTSYNPSTDFSFNQCCKQRINRLLNIKIRKFRCIKVFYQFFLTGFLIGSQVFKLKWNFSVSLSSIIAKSAPCRYFLEYTLGYHLLINFSSSIYLQQFEVYLLIRQIFFRCLCLILNFI